MIRLKRSYEKSEPADGTRFLVDRLWPRGIAKSDLRVDAWLKDAAPSDELRRWFSHDPGKWEEFQRRYFSELDENPKAWEQIAGASRHGTVTLVYSAHDTELNNAVALKRYVEARAGRGAARVGGGRPGAA